MAEQLEKYAAELQVELENILNYWINFTPDDVNGGFVGRIDQDNIIDGDAPKGAVLHARILWSFAAAYNQNSLPEYLEYAGKAYHYIADYFIDHEFGGVYWTVDAKGNPLDTKKQIYATAFTIYGLSEYFMASGKDVVKDHAVALYKDLIRYSLDKENGGYFEAFQREWGPLEDLRLSDKDANEKKTMNTHLHVLEAFTNLYRIWPDEDLKIRIADLLNNFILHIIRQETTHLDLFFDEYWGRKSNTVSYGHDIEASWLLLEAAEVIGEEDLIKTFKDLSIKLSKAVLEGVDQDGGLWYESEPLTRHIVKEKHWWVQAESMVGFFNAWQISKDKSFLAISLQNWDFVKEKIIDHNKGEWFWGVTMSGEIMPGEDKVGIWKCPYHNSRACIELIKRIGNLNQ